MFNGLKISNEKSFLYNIVFGNRKIKWICTFICMQLLQECRDSFSLNEGQGTTRSLSIDLIFCIFKYYAINIFYPIKSCVRCFNAKNHDQLVSKVNKSRIKSSHISQNNGRTLFKTIMQLFIEVPQKIMSEWQEKAVMQMLLQISLE